MQYDIDNMIIIKVINYNTIIIASNFENSYLYVINIYSFIVTVNKLRCLVLLFAI